MPETLTDKPQGPFKGSRCVAGPTEIWRPATIRRVNEDGSFKVELDFKEMEIMPYWYGVTASEISFDDTSQWPAVFSLLSPDGHSFTLENLCNALKTLGYQVDNERARENWDWACQKLFHVPVEQVQNFALDQDLTYQLFLWFGVSAKQAAKNLEKGKSNPYYKLYWNQIRMGGRDPAEVPRPITLEDAFKALGLTTAKTDKVKKDFLQRIEKDNAIRLPTALMEFFSRDGIEKAIKSCHPNNPSIAEFAEDQWELWQPRKEHQLQGDYALEIMIPHQGNHQWLAVFNDQEEDARIYVHWFSADNEVWLLTAPEIGIFFWDLAQTGLTWHQDTRLDGGKPVRHSDIGLILDNQRYAL